MKTHVLSQEEAKASDTLFNYFAPITVPFSLMIVASRSEIGTP